jgi:hypothetical protein
VLFWIGLVLAFSLINSLFALDVDPNYDLDTDLGTAFLLSSILAWNLTFMQRTPFSRQHCITIHENN